MSRRARKTQHQEVLEGLIASDRDLFFFFFQAEDGIRDVAVTGVQTCALPILEGLLESELFGHERGAFPGAIRTRVGRLELASGGTLSLDEIGDMPLAMQAKILRALEERKIERVGGGRPIDVDVRIIAATNQTLSRLVDEGRFRTDLFYRLRGIQLRLPPLRERLDDLPELINTFLDRARLRLSRTTAALSNDALQCLWVYAWPGNIRELKHVLEGAVLLSDGVILPEHLPPAIQTPGVQQCATPSGRSLDEAIDDLERQLILAALGRAGGVQVRAARLLGITEQSLWYRIKKHGIQARVGGSPPAWPHDIAALPPARPAPPVALASSAARDLDRLAKRSRFSAQKSNAG